MVQLVKDLPAVWVTLSLIPGLGRSPGERKGYLLQYSGLENSMDRIGLGVAKSRTQLSDFKKKKVLIRGGEVYFRLGWSPRYLKRRSPRYSCSFLPVLVLSL